MKLKQKFKNFQRNGEKNNNNNNNNSAMQMNV